MDSTGQKTAADLIAEARTLRGHIPEEFRRMKQCYEKAVQLEPDNWEALYWLGRCSCGSPGGEGIPYFEKAARLNPHEADILVYLSVAQVNCGRTQEAKVTLDKALALNPQNAEAHLHKALQLSSEGASLDIVLAEIVHCLQCDPTHPLAKMLYQRATGKEYT